MRFIGWLLVLSGLAALGYNVWVQWAADEPVRLWALGELGFRLFPESFQLLQPSIERHLSPDLWDPWVLTLMLWPAWAVLIVSGVVLIAISALLRRRRRRRRHRGW